MKMAGTPHPLAHALLAAVMIASSPMPGGAQGHDDHDAHTVASPHKPTPLENALVQGVRQATERFKHVRSVEGPGEGYQLTFGCVSGGDFGAMGLHYLNPG